MAKFATTLKRDPERNGMTQAQAACRLGVRLADYRRVEAGDQSATGDLFERTADLSGWPQASSHREDGSPIAGAP
jgi:transcriptional regulator with XRE-family HTH domain